jgi:hypothetical protein
MQGSLIAGFDFACLCCVSDLMTAMILLQHLAGLASFATTPSAARVGIDTKDVSLPLARTDSLMSCTCDAFPSDLSIAVVLPPTSTVHTPLPQRL